MDRNLKRKNVRRRFRFSRLSLKLASWIGLVAFVVSMLVHLIADAYPVWSHIVFPLLLAGAAYWISHQLLVTRITLARTTLKQVRKHKFENLEKAHLPRGDELNALNWQVYRTGLAMEKELNELKKIEDYRREFLGNVSHELKTPIFTIQGFAETLLDGALTDDRVNERFLTKILANTKRLRNLANDLVEISRIETGELEMVMRPFRLSDVVNEVSDELEQFAESKNVTLYHKIPATLPKILGDKARISQVMINLVDNAIKYSNPAGSVEIVARATAGGRIKVTVADDGIGIAPQHVPRLTERFYRVDKSRSREQGGTGLGLAIVKHILGAHGSEMVIDSKQNAGSTFGFTLQPVETEPAAPVSN
ncbi:MAG: ATP-binding protein [Bacteroidota bacterium]